MARNAKQSAQLRETRKNQILDAALTVYIQCGYHGTDMDAVAAQAQLAKGLLYYYYKTKKELFVELYTSMFAKLYALSARLLENVTDRSPVEQLMYYTHGVFAANQADLRLMRFSMRVPFDAYAVFGSDNWRDGASKSDMHRQALAQIIKDGIEQGQIPQTHPGRAANSFWSVFVANVFDYARMMTGSQPSPHVAVDDFRDVVRFCFQGLGIKESLWNACLEKILEEENEKEMLF